MSTWTLEDKSPNYPTIFYGSSLGKIEIQEILRKSPEFYKLVLAIFPRNDFPGKWDQILKKFLGNPWITRTRTDNQAINHKSASRR